MYNCLENAVMDMVRPEIDIHQEKIIRLWSKIGVIALRTSAYTLSLPAEFKIDFKIEIFVSWFLGNDLFFYLQAGLLVILLTTAVINLLYVFDISKKLVGNEPENGTWCLYFYTYYQ